MLNYSQALLAVVALGASLAQAQDTAPIKVSGGQVTIAEQVEVPALEIGIIGKLSVKEGDLVEDGQLLGALDDVDARLALRRAEAEAAIAEVAAKSDVGVRAGQNAHQTAKTELARALEAVEKYNKSISQTEIDRLKLAVEQSRLSIEQALLTQRTAELQFELKTRELTIAKRKVERHDIRSRVAGRVLQIDKRPGEWIEPGKTVLKIVRLDLLRCKGFVLPAHLTSDPTGRVVRITVQQGSNKPLVLSGKLVYVHPETSLRGDIEVWAEFDNRDRRVRPGVPAEMEILPAEKLAKGELGATKD